MTNIEFAIRLAYGWASQHAATWWAIALYLTTLTAICWAGRTFWAAGNRQLAATLTAHDADEENRKEER